MKPLLLALFFVGCISDSPNSTMLVRNEGTEALTV